MNRINKLLIGAALAGACIAPVQAQYYGGSSYSHFGNHHSYSIGINDAANLIGAVGTLIHGGDYGYTLALHKMLLFGEVRRLSKPLV